MDTKKFKMIDEDFKCEVCGFHVSALGYTARDHCPKCLCSKHVDVNPGDRASLCLGVLRPVGVVKGKNDSWKIIYECSKCGMVKKNKAASDDSFEKILELATNFH